MTAKNFMVAQVLATTRHFVGWVVLFAIMMVACIPAGFMPSKSGNGSFSVTICSGNSEKIVSMDAKTGMPNSSYPQTSNTPMCDVLGTLAHGQLNMPTSGVNVPAPILIILQLIGLPRDSIIRDLHNTPYVPRGPPQSTV